ncbi:MAG: hypothetical protein KIS87_00665 [Phycisphaeraceae bacterium]|nr:hypothetical protein [Phycisphaeraceae bacterium]
MTTAFRGAKAFDPVETLDLRRKRRRDQAEVALERARHLPPEDRVLVEAVFRDGRPVAELAALVAGETGATDRAARARGLRRRIRRLTARILSHEYAFVAEQLADWSPTRRRVATACVLHGRSIRDAAAELRLSLHTVRRHRAAIAELMEAWS